MAFSFNKFKSFLNTNKDNQLAGSGSADPEIGFKLSLHPSSKNLFVTVIGARNLPSLFGLSRAHGYLVKVKIFPGENKYETALQQSSWPIWNEDFKFQLKPKDAKKPNEKVDLQSQLAGHFLSLTIYAVLEAPKLETDKKKGAKTLDSKATMKLMNDEETKTKSSLLEKISSFKSTKSDVSQKTIEKRRTLGAATWNFDSKLFQNDLKNGLIGTPDIWRPINAIASGLNSTENRRENKKGQLEVTLLYCSSEDGFNDTVQLTVNRLRCSVHTMHEQEQYKAPLYLKATILEASKAECYWKSERFMPTISARWDPKSATVKLVVFKANLNKVSIYISLGCKNKMAKKEILGKATIEEKSAYSDSWKECLRQPGIPKTFWVNFE
ncbi:uncharacterized protein LOC126977124 [Leptidea sinapis]|uniref:C2 domain-containing protein n=1 Tax=Leptidea sinapis TaxID=189913 RepID=A0A5E4QNI7_9NEOP|nr:uncharacterized protein LOC126977124 [Leptidea sinapis]VVC99506.1 unnamed protein product [Leptidea sinapis]